MSANQLPIYAATPDVQSGLVLVANTNMDGLTGTLVTIWTADTKNGSIIDAIDVNHFGVNVASVLRMWVKSVGGVTSPLPEIAIPAYASISQVAAQAPISSLLFDGVNRKKLVMPAGSILIGCVGTVLAAGVKVVASGGHF
jgi:hypothetical protein